jgi:hypothetical protein
MNFERTQWGIVIGEKYLSACEALDLLQWLSAQQDALLLMSQEVFQAPPEPPAGQHQQTQWSLADEQEMKSEDEQIACFEL